MLDNVLEAFASWLKLNAELVGVADDGMVSHPLVQASLAALQSAEHFDAAVEAVMELIYCSGIMMYQSSPPARYMPLVQLLIQTVCFAHDPAPPQAAGLQRSEHLAINLSDRCRCCNSGRASQPLLSSLMANWMTRT